MCSLYPPLSMAADIATSSTLRAVRRLYHDLMAYISAERAAGQLTPEDAAELEQMTSCVLLLARMSIHLREASDRMDLRFHKVSRQLGMLSEQWSELDLALSELRRANVPLPLPDLEVAHDGEVERRSEH